MGRNVRRPEDSGIPEEDFLPGGDFQDDGSFAEEDIFDDSGFLDGFPGLDDATRAIPPIPDPLEQSDRLPDLFPDAPAEPESEEPEKAPRRKGRWKRVLLKTCKYLFFLVLAVAIVAAGGVGYLTVTEYNPAYAEDAQRGNVNGERKLSEKSLRILTLNTGYGGLDDSADFFMDGGESVNPASQAQVEQNMVGIEDLIRAADADIVLLQEVDTDSKRTFGIDQWRQYEFDLEDYESRYALNYSCDYVPYPLPTIGKVHSGIATFSRYDIESATRYSLPCPFSWPMRVANLKRCILVSRIPIERQDDQELVVVNVHLEAYDDGEGKVAQMEMLMQILEEEYAKGNYVIAGGDFNQSFPDGLERYPVSGSAQWTPGQLTELPEGWSYAWDSSTPTCRLLNQPYDPRSSETQYYVIDGFILSPNVELVKVRTQDADFAVTDHNPVLLEVNLK